MARRWTDYQRGVAEVVLRHRTEEGSGYDLNGVQQELPDVSKGIISDVAKALPGYKLDELFYISEEAISHE